MPSLITLADDPTGVTVTRVQALHIRQLREAVNSVRALAGLSAASWDGAVESGGAIRAAHIQELRDRLREALVELFMPVPTYTDATLVTGPGGTGIKRAHIAELRQSATRGRGAGQAGGSGGVWNIQWLVTDHLGTPRMIADLTGNLTGIRRHDYLPFGEEVGALIGGRTSGQGYSGDNVRQQFTGYERDDETGLDFAQARYFSNAQGRFTSPDPLIASARRQTPQSWNRYSYGINNPLKYVDPSGEDWYLNAKGNILGACIEQLKRNRLFECPSG